MRDKTPPCVLSIAGSDSSGGAGIQGDIKAISATGSYAATVITALTAQNSQGVHAIASLEPDFIYQQVESVATDLNVRAVKIGMVHDVEVIKTIAACIEKFNLPNVVLDPVMCAQGGDPLITDEAMDALATLLFNKVLLITPNLHEAERLLGENIPNYKSMESAAKELSELYQVNVLLKGGHTKGNDALDMLYILNEGIHKITAAKIDTNNTHGTGCSLSSAIASFIAQGYSLIDAVNKAKEFITNAIKTGSTYDISKGYGPIDHFYFMRNANLT